MRTVIRYTKKGNYPIFRKLEKDEKSGRGYATRIDISDELPYLTVTDYIDCDVMLEEFSDEENITKEEWQKKLKELFEIVR